ncbi:hypothetical protein BH23BAC4_BH23BAC4_01240 [soil metagenome]
MPYSLFLLLTLLLAPTVFGQSASTIPADDFEFIRECAAPVSDADGPETTFEAFLDRLDAGLGEFVNGDPTAFAAAWSHSADITIAGGFGGAIVRGWHRRPLTRSTRRERLDEAT